MTINQTNNTQSHTSADSDEFVAYFTSLKDEPIDWEAKKEAYEAERAERIRTDPYFAYYCEFIEPNVGLRPQKITKRRWGIMLSDWEIIQSQRLIGLAEMLCDELNDRYMRQLSKQSDLSAIEDVEIEDLFVTFEKALNAVFGNIYFDDRSADVRRIESIIWFGCSDYTKRFLRQTYDCFAIFDRKDPIRIPLHMKRKADYLEKRKSEWSWIHSFYEADGVDLSKYEWNTELYRALEDDKKGTNRFSFSLPTHHRKESCLTNRPIQMPTDKGWREITEIFG